MCQNQKQCKKLKIVSIEHIHSDMPRYDLTVNKLHHYFANNILVHNTDGQALAVTYKDGEVKAARNKATLKEPMSIEQLSQKFDGRGEIKEAFVKSMNDISKAIKSLSEEEKKLIFNDGHNYMAFEIIYPPTKNVIDYGNKCLIQLHGVNIYDEKWNKVSEDKKLAEKLYELLKQRNVLNQETFQITSDAQLKLKDSKTGEESLKLVLDKLATLIDGLGWNSTINDYAQERFEKYIINMAIKADLELSRKSTFVSKLAERISNLSKRSVTKSDLNAYAKSEGLDIKSQEFKDFVNLVDQTKDEANQHAIAPLEDLVIYAGLLLMKNLVGYISADPKKTSKRLAAELDSAINEISQAKLDDRKLARFKKNLAKLDKWQREVLPTEGIVFLYKGKVFKMTATYSQINQLIGLLKY